MVHTRTVSENLERRVAVVDFRELEPEEELLMVPTPVLIAIPGESPRYLELTFGEAPDKPPYLSTVKIDFNLAEVDQLHKDLKSGKQATLEYKIEHKPATGLGKFGVFLFADLLGKPRTNIITGKIVVEGGATYPIRLTYSDMIPTLIVNSVSRIEQI